MSTMTRIERIAPFLDALPDDAFEDFLSAAAYAVSDSTIYAKLPEHEKVRIDAAIGRLDAGQGVPYAEVMSRLDAKLKAAGA